MRRRLRRRPAPRKALTSKSTIWKAPGSSRLGGLRVVPLGKTGDAWLRTENSIRPRSYRAGWVGRYTLPPLLQGHPPHPDAPLSPCFAAESARGGTLMSLPEGIATPAPARLGTRGGGGVVRSDIRVPEAKRGRVPCRNEDEHCLRALPQRRISNGIRGWISPRARPSRSRR